jgi:hypothetical protein
MLAACVLPAACRGVAGEIREKQLQQLPPACMYMGRTSLTLNDIRQYNAAQGRQAYTLHENDCRCVGTVWTGPRGTHAASLCFRAGLGAQGWVWAHEAALHGNPKSLCVMVDRLAEGWLAHAALPP